MIVLKVRQELACGVRLAWHHRERVRGCARIKASLCCSKSNLRAMSFRLVLPNLPSKHRDTAVSLRSLGSVMGLRPTQAS